MEKGSLDSIKKTEVTDIKGLLSEKISRLPQEIVTPYGIEYQLKKYAGIDTGITLNKCTIEHGLALRRAVGQREVMHPVSHILTFSPFREEVIRELTDITPIAIGPYIAYAEDYRSEEERWAIKEKKGKVLLVMPSHSIQGIQADYSISRFIQQIEVMKKDFDVVMVCMYFEDMKHGMWKPYKEKGYQIVSAGNTHCPLFLSRLKYIFCLSDAIVANDVTTGMAYATYMNLPFGVIGQSVNHNVTCRNNAYELEMENYVERLYKLFEYKQFRISEEQKEAGKYLFGLENVKAREEMQELLISLSRTAGQERTE